MQPAIGAPPRCALPFLPLGRAGQGLDAQELAPEPKLLPRLGAVRGATDAHEGAVHAPQVLHHHPFPVHGEAGVARGDGGVVGEAEHALQPAADALDIEQGKAGPAAPSVRVVVRRRPRWVVLLEAPLCAHPKPHWAQKRNPARTVAPQRPQAGSAAFPALEGKGSGSPQSRQKRRLGSFSRPQRSHLTGFAIPIISPCVCPPVNATPHVVGR